MGCAANVAVEPTNYGVMKMEYMESRLNSRPHAASVLLHEIIEALVYRLELDLKHERITQLEAGLIQVFRDNPALLPCLSR